MKKLLLRCLALAPVAVLSACGGDHPAPQITQTQATQVRAQQAGGTVSIPGYRSNYTVTRADDGSTTIVRLLDKNTQVLAAGVKTIRFQDAYVSFDVDGIPGQAYRMYQASFNRKPDEAGLGYWIVAMQAGTELQTVAGNFYQSAEFQATYGALSNSQFIDLIYTNVLGRAPEAAGKDWWVNSLANGMSRAEALKGFSESAENKANLAAATKNGIDYLPFGGSAYQAPVQTYTTPAQAVPPGQPAPLTTVQADVLGTYKRLPVENGYHTGKIALQAGSTTILQWTNESGVSWSLTPNYATGALATGPTNPYKDASEAKYFRLAYVNGKLAGFYFNGEFYARDGVPLPDGYTPNLRSLGVQSTGVHGFVYHNMSPVPADYGYGFSMYVAMWPMMDKPTEHFQAGIGTFVQPINTDATAPLLPPDNAMRQSTPNESVNNWANLFQTIEGGEGNWVGTQYPVRDPKFHIAGTTDGYAHGDGSPGWSFDATNQSAQSPSLMSIAQLSNRILTAPDGYTFRKGTAGEFFGYAWMALPLTDARSTTVPIGDQSWTLFFNTTNFAGPVAFWVPDAWTRLSTTWAGAVGRGLDARPAHFDSTVIEFGNMPSIVNGDASGNLYLRSPRVLFPVDANNTTWLSADWMKYNKAAIFTPMRTWFAGGASASGTFDAAGAIRPTFTDSGIGLDVGYSSGNASKITGMDRFVSVITTTTPGGGQAFGLKWTGVGTPGVLPEYFKQSGSTVVPLLASEVPAETVLGSIDFTQPTRGATYTSPSTGSTSWMAPAPVAGPFQVTLADGSLVTYYWYRFVDQPALQSFGWSAAEKAQLQARVEKLHRGWSGTREFIPPPTSGTLATLDAAQLVTPPAGFEAGYVPIVTRQELAK